MIFVNQISASALLKDYEYKGYDVYVWIENGELKYFYLQTLEDYTITFLTYEDIKKYIDKK